ncbi:hypothetical protein STENM327S_02968 [Streptomyces tendae]
MRGVVMHAPGDFRVEEREDPKILRPSSCRIPCSSEPRTGNIPHERTIGA